MTDLASIAALCSEITVILGALALIIKPLRNKVLGFDKLTDALKCELRHDMLHTYYLDGEDGKTYKCERIGEAAGGKIVLQYLPHELVGNYFTAG